LNSFSSKLLSGSKSVLKYIGQVVQLISGLLLVFITTGWIAKVIEKSTSIHWSLGAVVAIILCAIVGVLLLELRSRDLIHGPVRLAVMNLLGAVLIGAVIAGWISFMLSSGGLAKYQATSIATLSDFIMFYIWVSLDIIPTLKIVETLSFNAPLKPGNLIAGIPVVAFKILVAFGVLNSFKKWWQARNEK
jgi:hypothetical protein